MRQKVLVADDESDMLELVSFNLRSSGYDVITAGNGLEALNQARSELPDLILLDLMLPELDGLAVCEILRRLPSTSRIPVIMLTAWSSELSRIIGLETGAEDYITKPFSPRELMVRVHRTLQTRAENAANGKEVLD